MSGTRMMAVTQPPPRDGRAFDSTFSTGTSAGAGSGGAS
jgi:hypothetical protein